MQEIHNEHDSKIPNKMVCFNSVFLVSVFSVPHHGSVTNLIFLRVDILFIWVFALILISENITLKWCCS